MKKNYTKSLAAALALLGGFTSRGQVSQYLFQQYLGTYSAISGGTVLVNGDVDNAYYTNPANPTTAQNAGPGFPIGFPFTFDGIVYDVIGVNNDGGVAFGQSTITPNPVDMNFSSSYTWISGTGTTNALLQRHIAPVSRDLQAIGGQSTLRVQTIGTAPTRVCVVQYENYRRYGSTGEMINFQIRLNEGTNFVDVVYGPWIVPAGATTGSTGQVGLRGATNADYNNRKVALNGSWLNSLPGTSNTDAVNWGPLSTVPDNGLTYEWIPPVPCQGTPANSSAVANLTTVCPNGTSTLNLNAVGIYTNTGLSFQWYSGTTSNVGPFPTAITGATNTSYVTAGLTQPTYYQVVVTCTNPGGSSNSITPVSVGIAATTTSAVPYFEGFEGISINNQLPNCSWLLSNPANAGTYVNATSANRLPRNGSKFAAFNATSGVNSFYTNAIQLNAGVTYSASMWYMTESTSLTNFTDLSMLIGMTQSPAGLSPIVSSNGPAIAQAGYKSLSGVFTVASSGLYYLAVRATSNGGTFYMSIDDIAITAPCSINSPTIAVSGASTTCSGQPVNINAAGANTYTWSVNNLHTAAISVTPVVTANAVINYSVTGTNTLSGCTSTIVRPITVNVGPAVSVFPLNQSVCEGGSVVLYASSTNQAANFVWSTTGTPGYSTSVTPAATSVYSVNATTNANNCVTTSTIAIEVVANPTVFASSTRNTVMCEGDALTLNATGATTYTWIANNTGALFIGSSVNPAPHVTTTYMVMGTDGSTGCTGTANITQNVTTCVGINNISAANSEISIYPNPNNGVFTVALADNSVKTISVTDVTGRVLLTNTSSDVTVDFNINAFAAGIYYVKVQSNDKAQVLKVVKH